MTLGAISSTTEKGKTAFSQSVISQRYAGGIKISQTTHTCLHQHQLSLSHMNLLPIQKLNTYGTSSILMY